MLQKTLAFAASDATDAPTEAPPPVDALGAVPPLLLAEGQPLLLPSPEGGKALLGIADETGRRAALVLAGGDVELAYDG